MNCVKLLVALCVLSAEAFAMPAYAASAKQLRPAKRAKHKPIGPRATSPRQTKGPIAPKQPALHVPSPNGHTSRRDRMFEHHPL